MQEAALAVMLVAAVSVHLKKGFFITNGGYEYNLVLGVAALTVTFVGPGPLSVDTLLGYSWAGAIWGAAALFAGLAAGTLQLAARHQASALGTAAVR